ncbi:MAG: hypothetical protein OXF02_06530 [Simkaniaceae bacterium]|nr:hypothetical protein [Simkaniaceae bacterium]
MSLREMLVRNNWSGLSEALDSSELTFSFSFWGTRMVSVGRSGERVSVDEIASAYLSSPAQRVNNASRHRAGNVSLRDRYTCFLLWDKVLRLYTEGDKEMGALPCHTRAAMCVRFIYRRAPILGHPEMRIREDLGERNSPLCFSAKQFREHWPDAEDPDPGGVWGNNPIALATERQMIDAIERENGKREEREGGGEEEGVMCRQRATSGQ